MNPKHTLPISEARKKIFDIAEEVQKPGTYYVLTEKGRPKAVVLSYEEYDSLIETIEVMEEIPELAKEVEELHDDIRTGKYKTYSTLEDILAKDGYVLAEKAKKQYGIRSPGKVKGRKGNR